MQVATYQSDDSSKWNQIHQKIHKEHNRPSQLAIDREALFPRGSIVCDLGGGTGSDVLYFLQKGHSVILLDISDFALKVAEKRAKEAGLGNNLVTHQIDFGLHKLPIKDNSIDIAYSRISLNYFGANHTSLIFKDVYRSLKPGGTAYLTFKSPDDEKEMERLELNAILYEPGVYIEAGQLRSRFTVSQLEDIAKKAGIKDVKVAPHQELLGVYLTVQQILHQNEVIFTKSHQSN